MDLGVKREDFKTRRDYIRYCIAELVCQYNPSDAWDSSNQIAREIDCKFIIPLDRKLRRIND